MCRRTLSVPANIVDSDHTSDVEVPYNESIELHCAAGGLPRPHVAWYFNDTPIHDSSTDDPVVYLLDDGLTLHIDAARLPHAGLYLCRAVNTAGSDEKRFNLTVVGQSIVSHGHSCGHLM